MSETAPPDPIAIVLPTYNEAENIEALIGEILALDHEQRFAILVVDDGSPDGTGRLVTELSQRDARVELISRPSKLGLGTAYLAGYRRALELEAELIFTLDADFSHRPAHIPELLALVGEADLVIGSRYIPGGALRDWPLHRRLLSAGANWLARLALGLPNRDCTSGFRCYRRELLRDVPLAEITSDGYSFLIDMLWHCRRAGARIVESPITFCERRGGTSKISKAEIFKAFSTLWRLWRRGGK
ncbi:polyprenol monophosphomannose synthase [Candidatus Sumerlaeota bacterium]